MVSSLISEAAGASVVVFSATTTPGLVTELTLTLNTENPDESEIIPEDTMPPVIQIFSPEAKDYTRQEILHISVDSSDEESGVSTTRISMDGIMKNSEDTIDLFFEHLGGHLFEVEAVDNVGNTATSGVEFQLITTPDGVISDIQRAYALGWITKETTKNQLIKKVERAIRIEKRIEKLVELSPEGKRVVKRLERLGKRIDRVLGKMILKELDRERGKTINEQAYQLLKEDIEWLLNK